MAGLKNIYQVYGGTPFQKMQGDSIMDRHAQLQQKQMTPYCQFCGGEIVQSPQDSNGNKVDPHWEAMNRAHYRCYRERELRR